VSILDQDNCRANYWSTPVEICGMNVQGEGADLG
jgi:hypothetical protein